MVIFVIRYRFTKFRCFLESQIENGLATGKALAGATDYLFDDASFCCGRVIPLRQTAHKLIRMILIIIIIVKLNCANS